MVGCAQWRWRGAETLLATPGEAWCVSAGAIRASIRRACFVIPQTVPAWLATQAADPKALHQHWQRITGSCEAALASPYLSHSPLLPESNPSVVVRVLTQLNQAELSRYFWPGWNSAHRWCRGLPWPGWPALPKPGEPFTAEQYQELSQWQEQVTGCGQPSVQACLDAAIGMHGLLPAIDRVAWDWIPAEPEPRLLEGNGSYGLLVPQLFQHLQKSSITGESRC